MKTKIIIRCLKLFAFVLVLGLIGCEGDIGPTGPTGPAGPQGPQGVAGEDGQNGAENCMDCHGNSQLITAKLFQWENSLHALGGNFDRNQATCAACHTSQGFLDRIASGSMAASEDVMDPLPPNCYTCHMIHQTYTSDDWALTTTDPVTFWVGGETQDIGSGNLCINCHQARLRTPEVPSPADTDSLEITSPFWGPHHGSQGALFTGSSAFEVGDGYTNSVHTVAVENSCIGCHMAPVTGGRDAGGHTFRVETEGGDLNTNGCIQCHPSSSDLEVLVETTQMEIEMLLEELKTKLIDNGLLGLTFGSYRAVPGKYTPTEVGVLWNYLYIEEDKSGGVHNYNYAKTLLENSIAALE